MMSAEILLGSIQAGDEQLITTDINFTNLVESNNRPIEAYTPKLCLNAICIDENMAHTCIVVVQ